MVATSRHVSWTLAVLVVGALAACKGRDSGYGDTSSAAGAVAGSTASTSATGASAAGNRLTTFKFSFTT